MMDMFNVRLEWGAALMLLASHATASPKMTEFVADYCVACHGPDKQKADRRFDDLPLEITTLDEIE